MSKFLSPINSRVLSTIDKFLKPKKSIFKRPNCSTVCISYCVTISEFSPFLCIGRKLVILSGDITIAAACIPS